MMMGSAKAAGSRSDSGGFTLVEMLAALLIMMVGLLGLLQAVIVALEFDTKNVLREESVYLAEEQMNNFRTAAARGSDTDFRAGFHTLTTASLAIRGGTRDFTIFKAYTTVSAGSSARSLRVRVTWNYRGTECQHEIYTVKSSR